jgi:hypothetical protein
VNVVIATPGLASASNCPPVTPVTVNCSRPAAVSASVADSSAPDSTTVPPSLITNALLPRTGASFCGVTVMLTVAVFDTAPVRSRIV